ncbi:LptF/LptG family permease [uncultured Sphaerochaeta sp.]|uniref:LptF/LptG family permease n=1 Tax=uncultured Sphaerochaeta sp. TaxID=886478 RepID=UPI002A0A6F93|nr:LptF/LptG family permease [uncultured Sphaerochaeta sp.]
MRLLDKHITFAISKVAFITMLLCSFMLISVDLFSHLDSYLQNSVPQLTILRLSILYLPEAALYAIAPSLLFSATFFLSQLQANNELICLLNAGISYKRIVFPVLVLGMVLSVAYFSVSELIAIPFSQQRSVLQNELFGLSSTFDNRNITLSDLEDGFVIHASHYNDEQKRISDVLIILKDAEGNLDSRIDASSATWDETKGYWILKNASVFSINEKDFSVTGKQYETYSNPAINLEPNLFRNFSADIKTMPLPTAFRYLKRIRLLSPDQWSGYATDLASRILGSFSPLVLLFIACTISYKYKKNVLLFSIILSLCIAVIYYVMQMLSLILAKQGVIGPVWGMVTPMIMIVCIAILERLISR